MLVLALALALVLVLILVLALVLGLALALALVLMLMLILELALALGLALALALALAPSNLGARVPPHDRHALLDEGRRQAVFLVATILPNLLDLILHPAFRILGSEPPVLQVLEDGHERDHGTRRLRRHLHRLEIRGVEGQRFVGHEVLLAELVASALGLQGANYWLLATSYWLLAAGY